MDNIDFTEEDFAAAAQRTEQDRTIQINHLAMLHVENMGIKFESIADYLTAVEQVKAKLTSQV
jgi:hypothetical protein